MCLLLPPQAVLKGQEPGANEGMTDRCLADVSLMCRLSFLTSQLYMDKSSSAATSGSLCSDLR